MELLNKRLAGKLDPDEEKSMEWALSGAHRLSTIIEGVLLYSRTVHEARDRTMVDSGTALSEALEEHKLTIEETGARIERGPLPIVRASAIGLARVFSNLVSNALKYRSAETPVVAIHAESHDDYWLFTVRDNGIGIDPADHSAIFDVFTRLQPQGASGSGVGLALCRRVIEDLGGRLWVNSVPGKGSTFHFTLLKS